MPYNKKTKACTRQSYVIYKYDCQKQSWNHVLHFKIKLQKRMEKTEKCMPHSETIVSLLRRTKKEYYGNLTRKM